MPQPTMPNPCCFMALPRLSQETAIGQSNEANACDLALADTDDQSVAYINKCFGIGDRLAARVKTDAYPPLLDHATRIGPARFEPQLLDQQERGHTRLLIELLGVDAHIGDLVGVFPGGPAPEFERCAYGSFLTVILRHDHFAQNLLGVSRSEEHMSELQSLRHL